MREAFSSAVGLALEQAKALSGVGALTLGPGRIATSEQLLEELLDAEARREPRKAPFGDIDPDPLQEIRGNGIAPSRTPWAKLPTGKRSPRSCGVSVLEDLPAGSVWPIPAGTESLVEMASLAGSLEELGAGASPRTSETGP